jgi:K+-transporting ATPase KdpF subunit
LVQPDFLLTGVRSKLINKKINGGIYMFILIGIIVLLFGYLSYALFNPEKF